MTLKTERIDIGRLDVFTTSTPVGIVTGGATHFPLQNRHMRTSLHLRFDVVVALVACFYLRGFHQLVFFAGRGVNTMAREAGKTLVVVFSSGPMKSIVILMTGQTRAVDCAC